MRLAFGAGSSQQHRVSRSLSRRVYTSNLFWAKHIQDFERAWPPPEGASKLRELRAQKSQFVQRNAHNVCVCARVDNLRNQFMMHIDAKHDKRSCWSSCSVLLSVKA